MEIVIGVVALIIGAALGFYIGRSMVAKDDQRIKEEASKQADQMIEDARRAAARKEEEAEIKAKRMIQDSEAKE